MINILFYFNSTIAQCMAALLALTGLFAVYRIQVQGDKLNRTMDAAKEFAEHTAKIKDPDAKMWLDYSVKENLIGYKNKLERDKTPDIEATIRGIDDYVCRIEAYSNTLIQMKKGILYPMYFCAFLLIISIVAISFTNQLAQSNFSYSYLVFISYLVIIAIFLIIGYIQGTLRDDEPAYRNLFPG